MNPGSAPTPARWLQIKSLFFECLEVPAAERLDFLTSQSGEDASLHALVFEMLDRHNQELIGFGDAPFQTPMPDRIGPYQVVSLVATSLTSLVLKAKRDDAQFDQTVAIKLLQPFAASPLALLRLESERKILATLNHPSICRLLDSGQLPTGHHYLILEWIEGISFLEHARNYDLRAKLLLFREICLIIEAAHRLLIVHRDLKPAHILMSAEGNLKILDFGIAKLLPSLQASDSKLTQQGQSPLTPAYASPEQWRGEPATASIDVFSLGILLGELLTGKHPFGASPALPHEWAARITSGELPSFESIPNRLQAIASMALKTDALMRYSTVESFRRDIENFLDDKPLLAKSNSRLHDVFSFFRRNRKYLLPATLTLAFAAFEVHQYWSRRELELVRAEEAQRIARDLVLQTFESLSGTAVRASTKRQILAAAAKQLELWEASNPSEEQLKEIASLYAKIGGHLGESFDENLEDFKEAERYARRSVKLWDSIPTAIPLLPIQAHMLLADIFFAHSKWEAARTEYENISQLIDRLPDAQSLAMRAFQSVALSMQGDILLAEGKPREALVIQQEVLAKRLEFNRLSGGMINSDPVAYTLANVHFSLAQTYSALNQSALAIEHAHQAVELHKQALISRIYDRELPSALLLLGRLLRDQRQHQAARSSFLEAEALAAKLLLAEPSSVPRQKLLNDIRLELAKR